MAKLEPARWWTIRRAQNSKPSTYRCPLCGDFLPALSEHVLIAPEGETSRRRHAHTACAVAARRQGRLPTREEWGKESGEIGPGVFARLAARLRGSA
jgi:hypothetical protein